MTTCCVLGWRTRDGAVEGFKYRAEDPMDTTGSGDGVTVVIVEQNECDVVPVFSAYAEARISPQGWASSEASSRRKTGIRDSGASAVTVAPP
jgi:hypothetical protein